MVHCLVNNCNNSSLNKQPGRPGVTFHPCPQSLQIRNKWSQVLKSRTNFLDWQASRICSRHFDEKSFDQNGTLKDSAVPSIFNANPSLSSMKQKITKALNKMSQKQLLQEIKQSIDNMEEPSDISSFVTNDLQIEANAPIEMRLWLIIQKQKHCMTKAFESVDLHKSYADNTRKSMEENQTQIKNLQKNVESYKFLIKTLQDKQATLEEQIEILTAVESRT